MEEVVLIWDLSHFQPGLVTIISDPVDSMKAAKVFKDAFIEEAGIREHEVYLQKTSILELPEAMDKFQL